jgi:hypothetical protein
MAERVLSSFKTSRMSLHWQLHSLTKRVDQFRQILSQVLVKAKFRTNILWME